MPRNEQLIRQHRLLQLLERTRAGQSLDELRDSLAKEMGLGSLHLRTVKRDLAALVAAGFDIESVRLQQGKVWRLGPRTRYAYRIQASASELIALSLGRDLLYPLAGTPFWHALETFWNKLRDELPPSVWKHYQEYRQMLYVRGMPAKSYERQHGILSALHRAIEEHRVVQIEYQPPAREKQTRHIEPYAVVFYQGSLYIVAAAHEASAPVGSALRGVPTAVGSALSGDPAVVGNALRGVPTGVEGRIRHLKLDRFLRATPLDQFFLRPPDFDLEAHLAQGIGIFSSGKPRDYKIRLTQRAARWVLEDPWHPAQKVEHSDSVDGEVVITVPAHHDLEIIPRILALGPEAELLSPASTREAIANIIDQLADTYANKK